MLIFAESSVPELQEATPSVTADPFHPPSARSGRSLLIEDVFSQDAEPVDFSGFFSLFFFFFTLEASSSDCL